MNELATLVKKKPPNPERQTVLRGLSNTRSWVGAPGVSKPFVHLRIRPNVALHNFPVCLFR